jgi:hypothetical protein
MMSRLREDEFIKLLLDLEAEHVNSNGVRQDVVNWILRTLDEVFKDDSE